MSLSSKGVRWENTYNYNAHLFIYGKNCILRRLSCIAETSFNWGFHGRLFVNLWSLLLRRSRRKDCVTIPKDIRVGGFIETGHPFLSLGNRSVYARDLLHSAHLSPRKKMNFSVTNTFSSKLTVYVSYVLVIHSSFIRRNTKIAQAVCQDAI